MTPNTGHELRRASADCFMCACGMGFMMCPDQRVAQQRHATHLAHIHTHRAKIKDAQANKIQHTLDEGEDPSGRNWCNPFGQGLFRKP